MREIDIEEFLSLQKRINCLPELEKWINKHEWKLTKKFSDYLHLLVCSLKNEKIDMQELEHLTKYLIETANYKNNRLVLLLDSLNRVIELHVPSPIYDELPDGIDGLANAPSSKKKHKYRRNQNRNSERYGFGKRPASAENDNKGARQSLRREYQKDNQYSNFYHQPRKRNLTKQFENHVKDERFYKHDNYNKNNKYNKHKNCNNNNNNYNSVNNNYDNDSRYQHRHGKIEFEKNKNCQNDDDEESESDSPLYGSTESPKSNNKNSPMRSSSSTKYHKNKRRSGYRYPRKYNNGSNQRR